MKNGCSYHDDCETCPFPNCIEGQDIERRGRSEALRTLARERLAQGQKPAKVAQDLGISRMSVYRYKRA